MLANCAPLIIFFCDKSVSTKFERKYSAIIQEQLHHCSKSLLHAES